MSLRKQPKGLPGFQPSVQHRPQRGAAVVLLAAVCAAGLAACSAAPQAAVPYNTAAPGSAALTSRVPNVPLGTPKGLNPGRVVWAHDPKAVDWDGDTGVWYEPKHFDEPRIRAMMSQTLCALAGTKTDAEAWDAIFHDFNRSRGRGDHGYQRGEKIMIKLNLSGLHRENDPESQRWDQACITTPVMTMTLLRQLVEVAGVQPQDITVGDTTAWFSPHFYNPIHAAWPAMHCLSFKNYDGREEATVSNHPIYWSTPESLGTAQDYAPTPFAQATYLINFAQLKAHNGGGVTLCGKNHFGSLIRRPLEPGDGVKPYMNLHNGLVSRPYGPPGYGHYRCMVDIMGHPDFGGKTLLYLLDGLFGYYDAVWEPDTGYKTNTWHSPPFNDYWPCSLLASQDPVAIDSVGCDIWWEEAPFQPGHYGCLPGADDYLHEAALADNPPSGTFYDPTHALPTVRLKSLGVEEHWNNPVDRQYSRNLGTGNGIELITIGQGIERPKTAQK